MNLVTQGLIVDKEKMQFAANITHDLRNPIAGIKTIAQSLQNCINSPNEKRLLQNIVKTTMHLSSLIDHILIMSKETHEEEKIDFFSLNDVVAEVSALISLPAEVKKIKVIIDCPEDIYVKADKYRCFRIILNLAENAIKYTNKGHVIIRCLKENDEITLQVEDTGIGISKREQVDIFKSYTQIEQGNLNLAGVGLGLHLVLSFVEQMGGSIAISSKKNKGSLFSFSFKSLE